MPVVRLDVSLHRMFVHFTSAELRLLQKLKEDLTIRAKGQGGTPPTYGEVIRGCVRMAAETSYGEDFVHQALQGAGGTRLPKGEASEALSRTKGKI